ncbi:hypothetical protein GCM10007242_30210 [Pigmentiphaga litoralis]|uniref:DUF4394 domain-containing protein n=1 Tax=Pigmentiphaga litoralis TaxID=516702 RepID=UPI0019AFD02D|nr:DUF4394 domain-containing protein [Pigmentiphaga litoralis]GGX21006.1 hypothetical protein GCM10007242_30210 [Pigmentiphaga litoralis]
MAKSFKQTGRKTGLASATPFKLAGAGMLCLALVACGGSDDDHDNNNGNVPPAATAPGDVVVLTAAGQLASFNRTAPQTFLSSVALSGLATTTETLVGMDFRPADNLLYGISTTGVIYTINPVTGVATRKSALAPATAGGAAVVLNGTSFGVDFNPAADRLRVISNTGQSLRINVDTGATIVDGIVTAPAGAATAAVTAAAYTNSFAGTVGTALYDIDTVNDLVYLQNPPNDGTLTTPVPLGVDASAANGFDIDATTNQGFAALTVGGVTGLYAINLAPVPATPGAAVRAATLINPIGTGTAVGGLAMRQKAGPTMVGLTSDSRLVSFKPATPGTLTSNVAITGLAAGETVVGIDQRPADGKVYGLSSTGRLFTVLPATGVATVVATLAADPADTTAPYTTFPAAGTTFSVDFNPVADRLRVITSTGASLRINVATGATTTDGNINRAGGAPVVAAAAYTNSFAGTTATALYDMERTSNVLSLQNPPNDGTLVDVGPLGTTIGTRVGFDIGGGANGLAVATSSTTATGPSKLFSVNIATGALTAITPAAPDASTGLVGGAAGPLLTDIAVVF